MLRSYSSTLGEHITTARRASKDILWSDLSQPWLVSNVERNEDLDRLLADAVTEIQRNPRQPEPGERARELAAMGVIALITFPVLGPDRGSASAARGTVGQVMSRLIRTDAGLKQMYETIKAQRRGDPIFPRVLDNLTVDTSPETGADLRSQRNAHVRSLTETQPPTSTSAAATAAARLQRCIVEADDALESFLDVAEPAMGTLSWEEWGPHIQRVVRLGSRMSRYTKEPPAGEA